MATRIGVDNLHYALMTAEETKTTAPTYGIPVAAIGLMTMNVNPNASQETLFADDGPMETATTLGNCDVELQKNQLSAVEKAALLGHEIDANGGLIYGGTDIPDYHAIGFRSLKSNGKYRYTWLYKGKFMEPESNSETKGDSINFQADTINGQFVRLSKPFVINGKDTYPWKYEIDEDDPDVDQDVIDGWFTAVTLPKEDVIP